MRNDAQELDERQDQLAEKLAESRAIEDKSPGLRRSDPRESIEKSLATQKERLDELLERMQRTVEEAETAEPLLAQQLYDSYRKTQQRQVSSGWRIRPN